MKRSQVIGALTKLELFAHWANQAKILLVECSMEREIRIYFFSLNRLRGYWMILTSRPKSQGKNLRICALTCFNESQDLCNRL